MSEWADILKLTVSLLAIVDPIASIPVFLTITDGEPTVQRARIARVVAMTVFCVLGVAALVGTEILHFFGISIPSFLIGGGIVLMIIATHQSPSFIYHLKLLIPALIIAVAVWATLVAATRISKRLGKTGMNIITRVMGLIIAAVAVEYVYRGLIELFPKLI